eukprot:354186-Chlamydomonas_euryale.AAC.4
MNGRRGVATDVHALASWAWQQVLTPDGCPPHDGVRPWGPTRRPLPVYHTSARKHHRGGCHACVTATGLCDAGCDTVTRRQHHVRCSGGSSSLMPAV